MRSTIRYYSAERGFGFIENPDPRGQSIFFHLSDVNGQTPLAEGTTVEFETAPNPSRKHPLRALNIQVVSAPAPEGAR